MWDWLRSTPVGAAWYAGNTVWDTGHALYHTGAMYVDELRGDEAGVAHHTREAWRNANEAGVDGARTAYSTAWAALGLPWLWSTAGQQAVELAGEATVGVGPKALMDAAELENEMEEQQIDHAWAFRQERSDAPCRFQDFATGIYQTDSWLFGQDGEYFKQLCVPLTLEPGSEEYNEYVRQRMGPYAADEGVRGNWNDIPPRPVPEEIDPEQREQLEALY